MRRIFVFSSILLAAFLFALTAHARLPAKIAEALAASYAPAEDHSALHSAYSPPDASKLHGYVVVLKGGIPAERARFFISWEDYDYRGAVVQVDKEEATTRRGRPYTYLEKGDVMAVAEIEQSGSTIYLKLISPEIYKPAERQTEKRFSRVTVMLGFKFPKEVIKNDDAEEVLKKIGEWLKPFPNLEMSSLPPVGRARDP